MAPLHFLANPARFRRFSQRALPLLSVATALALAGYMLLAALGASLLVWRHPLAALMARGAAPVGAVFCAVCLLTGSLWGRPMWGTYWVWDARLTSMLLLFFLYLGHMALARAYDDSDRGDRAAAILALVGVINLPIIKFSVDWWNTLHQPASVMKLGGPSIDISMLVPLLVMAAAFTLFFAALLLVRIRGAIIARKVQALRRAAGEAVGRFDAVRGEAAGSAL